MDEEKLYSGNQLHSTWVAMTGKPKLSVESEIAIIVFAVLVILICGLI